MEGIDYDLCMAIKFIYDDHIFTIINTGDYLEYYFDGQHWFDTGTVFPTDEAIDIAIDMYDGNYDTEGQGKSSV